MRTLLKTGMRPLTTREFYRLSESNQFCELIEGELVMPPSPEPFHQSVAGTIFAKLYAYLEVLSPSTAHYDRTDKFLQYARSEVVEMWLVDPEDRQVEVYRFDRQDPLQPERTLKVDDVLRTDLLPGFELPLERLFQTEPRR